MLSIFTQLTYSESNESVNNSENERHFIKIMTKHLNAVTNRNLKSLKSTLSPRGDMLLILPQNEIMSTVDAFMNYHIEWFAAPDWTFESKILTTNIKADFGMAIVEIIYREPLRDGKPYFNRMIVSYDLEKINNQWSIIKDHASSVEKSTDKVKK
jgi:hypothetical protein